MTPFKKSCIKANLIAAAELLPAADNHDTENVLLLAFGTLFRYTQAEVLEVLETLDLEAYGFEGAKLVRELVEDL